MQLNELERIARQIRRRDLQAVFEAGAGHIGGEMSVIDILDRALFPCAEDLARSAEASRPRSVRPVQGTHGLRALCDACQARLHSRRRDLDLPASRTPG